LLSHRHMHMHESQIDTKLEVNQLTCIDTLLP
jgi:hypothetical protein